jgi:hypothetical protein
MQANDIVAEDRYVPSQQIPHSLVVWVAVLVLVPAGMTATDGWAASGHSPEEEYFDPWRPSLRILVPTLTLSRLGCSPSQETSMLLLGILKL